MKLSNPIVRWTALVFVLAAFSGCGNSAVGPALKGSGGGGDPNPTRTGPDVLVVHPDGTTSWTQLPPGGGNPAGDLTNPGATSSGLEAVEMVDGSLGAKMRCGRFYLMVPPGAFEGTGTITMSMPDSTVMVCDLDIFPRTLNAFNEPVHLALCVNDTDASTDTLSMYWHDPDHDKWVDMGCDKDLSQHPEMVGAPCPLNPRGITTELRHFSKYSGGKAGW